MPCLFADCSSQDIVKSIKFGSLLEDHTHFPLCFISKFCLSSSINNLLFMKPSQKLAECVLGLKNDFSFVFTSNLPSWNVLCAASFNILWTYYCLHSLLYARGATAFMLQDYIGRLKCSLSFLWESCVNFDNILVLLHEGFFGSYLTRCILNLIIKIGVSNNFQFELSGGMECFHCSVCTKL